MELMDKIIEAAHCIEAAEARGMDAEITITIDGLELSVKRSVDKTAFYLDGYFRPEAEEGTLDDLPEMGR